MKYKKSIFVLLFVVFISNSWSGTKKVADNPTTLSEMIEKIQDAMPSAGQVKPKKTRRILVFSKASGFQHRSILTCSQAIKEMSDKTKAFEAVFSNDVKDYTAEKLKQYDAILFNNTVHCQKDFKSKEQREAILNFIKNGGGFIGIHSASDIGRWPEYTDMIGGKFNGHPWHANGTWGIRLEDPQHPVLKSFKGYDFKLNEELYKLSNYDRSKVRVLLTIHESYITKKFKQGRKDKDHAVAWVRDYGKGRVFYSVFGHNHHVCWDTVILEHWLAGIQFALGDLVVETKSIKISNREPNYRPKNN